MAATNGALTPPSVPPAPTSPSLAKRKRSEAEPTVHPVLSKAATTTPAVGQANGTHHRSLQTVLDDILSVLKSYDTEPSILNQPFKSTATRSASGEAASKKAKLTPPDSPTTIVDLVQSGCYETLDALEKDVELASAEVLSSTDIGVNSASKPRLADAKLQTNVLAFQKVLKNLTMREEVRKMQTLGQSTSADARDVQAEDADGGPVKIEEATPANRTVLTLYGHTQGPKQLFSSFQQPLRVPPTKGKVVDSRLDTSIDVLLPIDESRLPNIISTTEIFPTRETDDSKKKNLTFGKLFAPPANLPHLSPPKPAKTLNTRGNTIGFVPQDSLPKSSRKGSYVYANQHLSTGNWLGYGGVDKPKDPTSPTAKQKSRQRALSTGEAQLPSSEATLSAVKQAKEEALFRSAYSSFAPSRDDAAAIIPEETKNKVWWQKVGEKRFNDTFPIDPALLDADESVDDDAKDATDEVESFKQAVESFVPVEADAMLEVKEKSELEKNTDEILQEISELIETLASHQRIRNSSLATNPRTPVIQNASLANLAGSPHTPSTEEVDVYQMLKSQLTLMIAQLPPYAVSRLNGDQLEELNISRTILVETENYKGVLEEDQFSRLAKSAGVPAAGTPSLSRMASTGSAPLNYSSASNQYSRSASSVHASAARPVATPQSYFPQQQQQALQRSPSVHYQRSSTGPTQPYQAFASSFASATPRHHGYSSNQPFGQTASRPAYNQATPGQYYSQRPAASSTYSGATNSQNYQANPQAQSHNRYPPQQTQNGYYQRHSTIAPSYAATPNPHMRTNSPLKAGAPQATYGGARPSYSTPGGPMRSTYYPPAAVQPANQYGSPQPLTASNAAGTPGAYSAQRMMLDRQQAQLAAQSQARTQAQNTFNRQNSGTPQSPSQYGNQQQVNGSPMVA